MPGWLNPGARKVASTRTADAGRDTAEDAAEETDLAGGVPQIRRQYLGDDSAPGP